MTWAKPAGKNSTHDGEEPGSGTQALALVVLFGSILYMFMGIGVICDEYLCEVMEVMSEKMDMDEVVSSATLMAMGSSAPEFATMMAAVMVHHDSAGLGAIMGASAINLVLVVGLTGLVGKGPELKFAHTDQANFVELLNRQRRSDNKSPLPNGVWLDWRPLMRDVFFYTCSLALVCVFAVTPVGDAYCKENFCNQSGFVWWEGLTLVLMFTAYIRSMIYNETTMNVLTKTFGLQPHIEQYAQLCQEYTEPDDSLARSMSTDDVLRSPSFMRKFTLGSSDLEAHVHSAQRAREDSRSIAVARNVVVPLDCDDKKDSLPTPGCPGQCAEPSLATEPQHSDLERILQQHSQSASGARGLLGVRAAGRVGGVAREAAARFHQGNGEEVPRAGGSHDALLRAQHGQPVHVQAGVRPCGAAP